VDTLDEIEAAVDSLPPDKKAELLRFIVARLSNGTTTPSQQIPLARSKRGFPISKGRIPFTSADVTRMELESDSTL